MHFASTESFDLSEKRQSNGCRLSVATGFVLTFLAIAVAVGVGILVYFANRDAYRDKTCDCNCGLPTSATVSGDNDVPQVCRILAGAAFQPLCGLCPKTTTTTQKPRDTTTMTLETTTVQLTTTQSPPIPPIGQTRLPRALIPSHYNLKLRPQIYNNRPETFDFTGEVQITLKCYEATDRITLHASGLALTSKPVIMTDVGQAPEYKKHTMDVIAQFLVLELSSNLTAGQEYTLKLQFRGTLPPPGSLLGFYSTHYTTGNTTKYQALGVFQPIGARTAFPCFDEPNMKATFNISLERKTNSDIITQSNMPLMKSIVLSDGFTQDIFEKSVIMPTYLVAFSFNNFAYNSKYSSNGTLMGVLIRPDSINKTDVALDFNVKLLDAFEVYFQDKYPIPKLDSLAAPQFVALGLEIWSLVAYKEELLVYEAGKTPSDTLENAAVTYSHELAHTWTGNLVTMDWWDNVWLNEGFAVFLSLQGLDMVVPKWKMTELNQVKLVQAIMETDGYETANSLHLEKLPTSILGIFNLIPYNKGYAVVRMANFFMGERNFRTVLQEYIQKNRYGNADNDNLYASMQKVADREGLNLNITNIMDTWVEQTNYPFLYMTYNVAAGTITVHQRRFLFTCSLTPDKCFLQSRTWEVPFTYTTSTNSSFDQSYRDIAWIPKTKSVMVMNSTNLPNSTDGWVIGNVHQYGYYRMLYSKENWQALQRQLERDHTVFPVLNRAQLIDDSWSFSKAGMLDFNIALNMMNYLKKETEYTVWQAASAQITSLDMILEPTATYGKFEAFMVNLVKDQFSSINVTDIETKTIQERQLSKLMFQYACKYLIKSCEEQSLQLFQDFVGKGKRLPPDVTKTIVCTAVGKGGETEWNAMYNLYKANPGYAGLAIYAMSCTRRHWLQRRYLDFALSQSKINNIYIREAIKNLATNPDGYHQAVAFLNSNWRNIVTKYGIDATSLGEMITAVAAPMYTQTAADSMVFWRDQIHPKNASKIPEFDTAIARIKVNQRWFERNQKVVDDWLSSQLKK